MMNKLTNRMGPAGNRRKGKGKKGKNNRKGKGRSQQRMPQGMPGIPGAGNGMPDLSRLGGSLGQMPPGLEGMDLSKLKFPKF